LKKTNLRRIFGSLFTIGVVAIVAIAVSNAFFSDSETSLGNTFVAGDIDLQIDNESYAIDWNIPGYPQPTGAFVASTHTSWELRDLTVEKFFDFVDLKPGDYGEDTISVHVGSNDAWMCAAAQITEDQDNSCTDPENADDPTCQDPGGDGELDEEVNFAFWVDDGDNVFEIGEPTPFLSGPISGIDEQGQITLADSQSSILGATNPIPGGTTFYIGKYWCFGDVNQTPVDPASGPQDETRSPLNAGTGFSCSGASVDNAAQTDSVVGDLEFYAEQSRNNPDFSCDTWLPEWVVRVESPELAFGPNGWGGWSCPVDTHVVGGGYEPGTATVQFSGPAKAGEPLYPVYPHYTYIPPETGWVVQNDNDGESITVFALCAPN